MHTLKTSKARENILKKIRLALQEESLPVPYPDLENKKGAETLQPPAMASLEESFAYEFTKAGGHFVFCEDKEDALKNFEALAKNRGWTEVLCAHQKLFSFLVHKKLSFVREFSFRDKEIQACITTCEVAVARTGSIVVSSRQNFGRTAGVYYPVHLVVLLRDQVVADIEDGLKYIKKRYDGRLPSMINFTTGPSRTADIEKTLVTGIHGPKEIFCFFINQ